MSTFKIKKGDTVKVIAGKDKDKEGKVISVNPKKGAVLVEGVNMVTKHTKPSMANQQGGIVEKEAWLTMWHFRQPISSAITPASLWLRC